MTSKEQLPTRIKNWLLSRGITESVIEEYEIGWNGEMIVIPVHDEHGKVLFNKYRRDPEVAEGPKYRYEKGATSHLYGVKTLDLSQATYVVICEGELDCLRLKSAGIPAVTSTGGASTFKEEWVKLFDQYGMSEVYICLDTDDTGIKGAFHVQQMIPRARVVLLPKEVKDVTEFFLHPSPKTFTYYLDSAQRYLPPSDWRHLTTKSDLNHKAKEYKESIDALMLRARDARAAFDYQQDHVLQLLIQMYMIKMDEVKLAIKYFQVKRADIGSDRIARAKAVPIPLYIKFNREKFAPCIWHNEKTGSMYYYEKQNRVKCFGCDKLGDVIDVVQTLRGVGLREALDIILNEHGKEA